MEKEIDSANTLEPLLTGALEGHATKPDNEAIALLLQDLDKPGKVQPVVMWRSTAQQVVDTLQAWLKTPALPGATAPTSPRH